MAKLMGVPIGKLCAGVNINGESKVVMHSCRRQSTVRQLTIRSTRFYTQTSLTESLKEASFINKRYKRRCRMQSTLKWYVDLVQLVCHQNVCTLTTISTAQPYNFERILYYLTRGNNTLVKQWMQTMEQTQQVTLDGKWLERLQTDFCSARITDDEMCSTLRRTFDEWGYVVDPHTAVALAATERLGYQLFKHQSPSSETKNHVVVLATASPCKFQEAVTVALGEKGWEVYIKNCFPSRARDTMDKDEIKPYHYTWREGATVKEVQSEWRLQMLEIVNDSF